MARGGSGRSWALAAASGFGRDRWDADADLLAGSAEEFGEGGQNRFGFGRIDVFGAQHLVQRDWTSSGLRIRFR